MSSLLRRVGSLVQDTTLQLPRRVARLVRSARRLAAAAAAGCRRGAGFRLLELRGETLGQLGGPRRGGRCKAQIDSGESFVLVVPAAADRLGWLWGQALLAERIYDRPLRDQLREWGWRPQSLTISDDEVAVLARRGLAQDPAEWGGGGLQPDLSLLLDVLAGGSQPRARTAPRARPDHRGGRACQRISRMSRNERKSEDAEERKSGWRTLAATSNELLAAWRTGRWPASL